MNVKRHALFCIVLGALWRGVTVASAQVSVEVNLEPRVLAIGEHAQLSVAVRGARRPTPPNMPARAGGLQIRFAGSQRRFSIINNERDEALVYLYDVFAEKAGEFDIGPLVYTVDGARIEIPAVRVRVVAAERDRPGEMARELSDVLFAEWRLERTRPFVDEGFDLVLVIGFRRVNLAPEVSLNGLPEVGLQFGRWEELPGGREARNDRLYEVRRFRSRVRPLAAGTYRLAATLRLHLLVERSGRRRSPLDEFFSDFPGLADMPGFGRVEKQPVDLPVRPAEVEVRPLPSEGRPDSFSGAVGRFDFDVTVNPTSLAAGEPVTVRMVIEGEGNLESASPPALNLSEKFRSYETRLVASETDRSGRRARRVYEQVLIPREETANDLPAIEFACFDPVAESYRVIRRGPFALDVRPATSAGGAVLVAAGSDEGGGVRVSGTDIVYLKPAPARWRRADEPRWYERPLGRAYPWLVVLGVAGAALAERRRARRLKDPSLARRERAPRAARAGLQRAEKALRAGDRAAFYDAVWRTLVDYFGHRLDLPSGEVIANRIIERAGAEAPKDWADEVRTLFAACEAARYAIGSAAPDDRVLLNRLRALLRQSERMRWRGKGGRPS